LEFIAEANKSVGAELTSLENISVTGFYKGVLPGNIEFALVKKGSLENGSLNVAIEVNLFYKNTSPSQRYPKEVISFVKLLSELYNKD